MVVGNPANDNLPWMLALANRIRSNRWSGRDLHWGSDGSNFVDV
jgi:hypothetical protein